MGVWGGEGGLPAALPLDIGFGCAEIGRPVVVGRASVAVARGAQTGIAAIAQAGPVVHTQGHRTHGVASSCLMRRSNSRPSVPVNGSGRAAGLRCISSIASSSLSMRCWSTAR